MDSNILSIPFKKTYLLPIRKIVREYLSVNHTDIHPDEFRWDIERWDTLRKESTDGIVHVDRIKRMQRYSAVSLMGIVSLTQSLQLPCTISLHPHETSVRRESRLVGHFLTWSCVAHTVFRSGSRSRMLQCSMRERCP